MFSSRKSYVGLFLIGFVVVFAATLLCFSMSQAVEAEFSEPVTEPAVDPVVDPVPVADPIGGPLTVKKGDVEATTDECIYEDSTYKIKASGLTFSGEGTCHISMFENSMIENITFDNLIITWGQDNDTVHIDSNSSLTVNIKNSCSFTNTSEFYQAFSCTGPIGSSDLLVINGDISSSLNLKANGCALSSERYVTSEITGGVSINATSNGSTTFSTNSPSLILNTSGKVLLNAPITESGVNIRATSPSFKMTVNGYLEMHGPGGRDPATMAGVILTNNIDPNSIIVLGNNVKMVGSIDPAASLAECKDRVSMDYVDNFGGFCLSCIDGKSAGTMFFIAGEPEPTPGGETYVTAQTGDSIPGVVIAVIALVALSSFVVMRSRKFNF